MVAAAYPEVRIVKGDLDDAAIIEKESASANIIIGEDCFPMTPQNLKPDANSASLKTQQIPPTM